MTSSGCGGRETTRWAGIPDRAAGRRSGSPLRRDDGAGVERRGPLEAAAHGRAVGLEGPRDEHKRRSCPARPDDAEGGAGPRQASRTAGERKTRGSHPASHVLLASGNAWSTGPRDPGSGGHQDLSTTQRYMHVSPAAVEDAIRLLDQPVRGGRGDRWETNPILLVF
jgi:hypothetical protein